MFIEAILSVLALNITLPTFFVGEYNEILILIDGTARPELIVSFGDGSSCNSLDHSSLFQFLEVYPHTEVTVGHVYHHSGRFLVSVNASNSVSSHMSFVNSTVVERIGGVKVSLISPPIIALFDEVIVEATAESGTDLQFEWDFDDDSDGQYTFVENYNRSSSALHSYGVADSYSISVKISSPYEVPFWVFLNETVQAVEPIRQLSLHVLSRRYVIALHKSFRDSNSSPLISDEVPFEACVQRGSDVEFLFQFGDGYESNVSSVLNVLSIPCGVATHAFSAEGVYEVSVTALNPLGSAKKTLNRPMVVQTVPGGLTLDEPYYIIHRNTNLSLHASLTSGTNVSFQWMVNKIVINHTDADLVLPFPNPGNYLVTVEAYNDATDEAFEEIVRLSYSSKVYVQEELQNLELCIKTVDLVETCDVQSLDLPLDRDIDLEVKVSPRTESALRFMWEVGLKEVKRSNHPNLKLRYRHPGWYAINVTVQNHISIISSGVLNLHLIQRLRNLTGIHSQGPNLIKQPITYSAFYWFGSDLTFEWDFGDNSQLLRSNSPSAKHTYDRTGEYEVRVHVWNQFSSENISSTMFILEHSCMKPELLFMDQSSEIKVFESEDLSIEAHVISSCDSFDVQYEWVIMNANRNQPVEIQDFNRLRERQLLLPAFTLPVGIYSIKFKVKMVGTIVHNSLKTILNVLASPPVINLRGGLMRPVNYNGALSMALEIIPNQSSLTVHWHCTGLVEKHIPCFPLEVPSAFVETDVLDFRLLTSSLDERLQTVIIDVSTMGLISSSFTQVIDVYDEPDLLLVSVECQSCFGHSANQHKKLAFEIKCDNCHLYDDVEFSWTIWQLLDGQPFIYSGSLDCVQADGSTFYIMAPNASVETFMNVTSVPSRSKDVESSITLLGDNKSFIDELPPFPMLPGFPDQNVKEVRKRRQSRPQFFEPHDESLLYPFDNLVIEGDAFLDNNMSLPDDFMDEGLSSFSRFSPFDPLNPIEGYPGEKGSAAARNLGQPFPDVFITDDDISEDESNDRTDLLRNHLDSEDRDRNDDIPGDPIRDYRFLPVAPHVVNQPKIPFIIDESNTTTGLNSMHLILKPNVLRDGHGYLIQVQASSKRKSSVASSAMDYVQVNKSPVHGRCTLMPLHGHSLESVFRLHCFEWQSEFTPLYYEVKYSLDPGDKGNHHLIYFGMSQNVRFVLPQGYAKNNYSVYLSVNVYDNRNSFTKVCSLVRQVYPLVTNLSMEQYIHNETFHPKCTLKKLLGEKQNQAVVHRIHVYASVLNSHNTTIYRTIGSTNLGKTLRQHYLKIIDSLNIYSKAEAVEILSALSQITSSDKVNSFHLNLCVRVLHKLLEKKDLFGGSYPTEELEEQIISTLSRLAVTANHLILSGKNELLEVFYFARNSLTSAVKSMMKMLRVYENAMSIERPHLSYTAAYVSRNSGQRAFVTKNTRTILSSLFHWIEKDLENSKCTEQTCPRSNSSCFAVIAEEHSLFADENHKQWSTNHPKYIISYKLYSCQGLEEIPLNILLDDTSLETQFTDYVNSKANETYVLHSSNMNIHRVNISSAYIEKSLHMYFECSANMPQSSDDLFPVAILFGYSRVPDPGNYLLKFDLASCHSAGIVHVFIPAYLMKETGSYYLALFNSEYSSNSDEFLHKDDARKMEYRFSIFVHSCIQKVDNKWSDAGCITEVGDDIHSVVCKCHSLDGVSVQSAEILSESSVLLISDALKIYINPIVAVLFLVFFTVFFALLILTYRSDRNKPVYNLPLLMPGYNPSHPQKYLITVCTGPYWNAGTTSSVYVVIKGKSDLTTTKQLIGQDGASYFHRGSEVTFVLSLEKTLGALKDIEIWHNNSGSSPSWYLSKMTIQDCVTGVLYKFPCYNWLATTKSDNCIERVLRVNLSNPTFTQLFQENVLHCLSSVNIWNSLYCNNPTTLFTGVQRLTCCLCFALSSSCLLSILPHLLPLEDYSLTYLSPQMVAVSLAIAIAVSAFLFFLSLIFVNSHAPAWNIVSAAGSLLHSLSLRDAYCWLQRKYSFHSGSSAESQSNYGSSSSVYSSRSDSRYSSSSIEYDDGDASFNKECFSVSSKSCSVEVSHKLTDFETTMITLQAIKNWSILNELNESNNQSLETYVDVFTKKVLSQSKIQPQLSNHSDSSKESASSLSQSINSCNDLNLRTLSCRLPVIFYYFSWLVLAAQIILGPYYSIIYTSRMGHQQSLHWLKAVFVSIVFSCFLVFPVLSVLSAVLLSVRFLCQKTKLKAITTSSPGGNINTLISNQSVHSMSQRFLYFRNYLRPPALSTLLQSQRQSLREKFVFSLLRKTFSVLLLLVILLLLASTLDDNLSLKYKQAVSIKKAFARPRTKVSSFWPWMEVDFLNSLYGQQQCISVYCAMTNWRGCYVVRKSVVRKYNNVVESCKRHRVYHPLHQCYVHKNNGYPSSVLWWEGHESAKLSVEEIRLSTMRLEAQEELLKLKSNQWINNKTVSVEIEALLFNPALSSLFLLTLNLKVNNRDSGVFNLDAPAVLPLKLIEWSSHSYILHCVLEILLLIMILVSVKKQMGQILKSWKYFWSIPWNCFEIVFNVLSCAYIVCSFLFVMELKNISHHIKDSYVLESYKIQTAAHLQTATQNLLGFLIFLQLIQCLQLVKFDSFQFTMMKMVFSSWKPLAICGVFGVLLSIMVGFMAKVVLHDHGTTHNAIIQSAKVAGSYFHKPEVKNANDFFDVVLLCIFLCFLCTCSSVLLTVVRAVVISCVKSTRVYKTPRIKFQEALKVLKYKLARNWKPVIGKPICKDEVKLPMELLLLELETLADRLLEKVDRMEHELETSISSQDDSQNTNMTLVQSVSPSSFHCEDDLDTSSICLSIQTLKKNDDHEIQLNSGDSESNASSPKNLQKMKKAKYISSKNKSSSICKTQSMGKGNTSFPETTITKVRTESSTSYGGVRKTESRGKLKNKELKLDNIYV